VLVFNHGQKDVDGDLSVLVLNHRQKDVDGDGRQDDPDGNHDVVEPQLGHTPFQPVYTIKEKTLDCLFSSLAVISKRSKKVRIQYRYRLVTGKAILRQHVSI
jgi:hypothetical protein